MKLVLNRILLSLLMISVAFYLQESFAEIIGHGLGPVTDLNVGTDGIYYFETDTALQSPTWLHDTQIKYFDNGQLRLLSTERFIYPTELNHVGDFLIFATLSDACVGQITCDFQNVVRMSTKDGSFKIIDFDLKSAIHISIDENSLYVSESHGNIWKMNLDGSNKKLIHSGSNIIMDMTAYGGSVYWIEEIGELENQVLQIDENTSKVTVIDDKLSIPYNLKVTFGKPTWNDVRIKPSSGSINEFTFFKLLNNDEVITIAEFKNTSPISKSQLEPHYKPYFVYGDYIIMANNTADHPVIQLLNYKDGNLIDIETIRDYMIGYFRSDHQNLYIIGQNDDGFVIEKLSYPITVPEFGPIIMILIISMFVGIVLTKRLLPLKLG